MMKSFVLHGALPFFIIVLGATNCLADDVDELLNEFKGLICDFKEVADSSNSSVMDQTKASMRLRAGERDLNSKYGSDVVRSAVPVVMAEFNEIGSEIGFVGNLGC